MFKNVEIILMYTANTFLLSFNNRNTRKKCEICSNKHQGDVNDVIIVKFEHISHLFLVFLLLTLKR